MSRSLVRTAAAVAGTTVAVASAFAATAVAAPTGDGSVPTFQQFAASTFQDLDGNFVVNGDEPATSTGALRQFYDDDGGRAGHHDGRAHRQHGERS